MASELIGELAGAASFESMRARGDNLAPDPSGVLKDKARFFRSGRSGAGVKALTAQDIAAYRSRSAAAAPAELLAWLHRD